VYLLLQACLGLRVDGVERRIRFDHARLPDTLDWVRIENLTVQHARVDVELTRRLDDVTVTILRRDGDVEVSTRR
jgi:hypothetical protein